MTVDRPRMLGRYPSRPDPRTLRLSDYADPAAPPPPPQRLWQTPVSDWGVMGNNLYGNCTIVTPAHAILAWRANELSDTRRISDNAVIELSREMGALNGYNILDRLRYWRKLGMWANLLWAFASVDPLDRPSIARAINTFGVVDIGVNLPLAWRNADEWTTGTGRNYRPGSWGGHSVPLVGYDKTNVYAVTWGQIVPMTWDALTTYCDEAYALIDPDWIAGDSFSPSGLDLNAMHVDLMTITK